MAGSSRFRRGRVSRVVVERQALQRVEVDGFAAAVDVLTDLVGPVAVGDEVIVNLDPVELALAPGASVVHWNLARHEWVRPGGGHILKVRYTSFQADTGVIEEHPSDRPWPDDLGGTVVVGCSAHDQLTDVVAALRVSDSGLPPVLVMVEGGALAVALSDTVARLRVEPPGLPTVTAGQAFGGDHEAVNHLSALLAARMLWPGRPIVVAAGPMGRGGPVAAAAGVAAALDGAALLRAKTFLVAGDDDPVELDGPSTHPVVAAAEIGALASRVGGDGACPARVERGR